MDYKYFVCFWAETNGNVPMNDILQLNFDIFESSDNVSAAEKIIGESWFGDDRKIVILNIIKC